MKKYYAIKIGKKPGIYNNWDIAKAQVDGFSGSIYKSFKTEQEAKEYLKGQKKNKSLSLKGPIAYVDGSFKNGINKYGSGVWIRDNTDSKTLAKFSFSGKKPEFLKSRNVAGEIFASLRAMEWALKTKNININIVYDYFGIEKWIDEWKTNEAISKFYKKEYDEKYKDVLNINFIKIKGHSGNVGNEKADKLASKGLEK